MGNRGPLPVLKAYQPAPMTSTTPPDWLGEEARLFWEKHRPALEASGVLNSATEDGFAALCDLWGRYKAFQGEETNRCFLDTKKALWADMKQFRLLPTEKPMVEPGDRHSDKPEFEF